MKVFLALFLFSTLAVGFASAQSSSDIPFLAEYRKRYEANNINRTYIILFLLRECQKKCSEKDNITIRKLAESGDMLSLAILPYMNFVGLDSFFNDLKYSADKGESESSVSYGWFKFKNNEIAEKYWSQAYNNGDFHGHVRLASLYERNNRIPEFCALMKEGQDKFGFEVFSGFFVQQKKVIQTFLANCAVGKEEDFLVKMGDEGKLIRGCRYVKDGEYGEAYKLFKEIYKKGDTSKISSNAGYCLGMMTYYGKGVNKDISKGRKLLKESFANGVYYADTPEQSSLPKKIELISYYAGTCLSIK